jgi:hypothetical protein
LEKESEGTSKTKRYESNPNAIVRKRNKEGRKNPRGRLEEGDQAKHTLLNS